MLDAHDLHRMVEVLHGPEDVCLGGIGGHETAIEGYLAHAALGSERTQLVVGEVALVVAECPAVAVGADNGLAGNLESVVERLLATVAQVDHYTATVHLGNDFRTERTHSAPCVEGLSGRVAYLVVAVMAQCEVHGTATCEVSDKRDVVANGKCVLHAKHYRLASLRLVHPEVCLVACYGNAVGMSVDDGFYLVEDEVCVVCRGGCGKRHHVLPRLAAHRLRNVCHHCGGVLPSVGHLVYVDKYLRITPREVRTLRKEHRRVAV